MRYQTFGVASLLDPPITFGEEDYVIACQFNNNPEGNESPVIVDAVVESVSGTTTKTIVCKRHKVKSSYTDSGREILYDCLVGGNVCSTIEPERIYSPFNPDLIRGDDSHRRSLVGDAVWYNNKAFLRTGGGAYKHAPSSVSWQGEDVAPISYLQRVDINDVFFTFPTEQEIADNPNFEVHYKGDGTSIYDQFVDFSLLHNGSWLSIPRRIFDDDELVYPFDATFSNEQPEYWVNTVDGKMKLSYLCRSIGNFGRTRSLLKNLNIFRRNNPTVVLEGSGEGYGIVGGTEDSLYVQRYITSGQIATTFDIVPFLIDDGEGNPVLTFGSGSIEIREDFDADGKMAAIVWNESGITNVYSRSTKGAALTNHSFSIFPFISFQKTSITFFRLNSGQFEFIVSHIGSSTVKVGPTINLSIPLEKELYLGVGTTDKCVSKVWKNEEYRAFPLSPGSTSLFVERMFNGILYDKSYDLAYATDLIEIRNELYQNLMVFNPEEPARNSYDSDFSTYVNFSSESSGDVVRIVQENPDTSNPTPGRAPRTFGIKDFADGGTDVNDNKAHWHDTLIISDPYEEFDAVAGDTIQIRRNAIFDPSAPPVLYVSKYNGSPWSLIDSSYYLMREVEGIVLFKQEFLDDLSSESFVVSPISPYQNTLINTDFVSSILSVTVGGAPRSIVDYDGNPTVAGTVKADPSGVLQFNSADAGLSCTVVYFDIDTSKLCIRAFGTMFSQSGEMQARQVNDMAAAIESFDNAFLSAPLGGGFMALGGLSKVYSIGPESFSFDGCDVFIDGLILGNRRAGLASDAGDLLHDNSATLPAWRTGNDLWIGDDLSDEHNAILSAWYPAPSPCTTGYTLGELYVEKNFGTISLGGLAGVNTNLAGVLLDDYDGIPGNVSYNMKGVPITPNGPLARIPDGSTILEAKLNVYFDGMHYRDWTIFRRFPYGAIFGIPFSTSGFEVETVTTVNGATVRDLYKDASDTFVRDSYTSPPTDATEGNIGFKLIGKRKNTKRVQLLTGEYVNGVRDVYSGVGSGISLSLAKSGKWNVIDVSSTIQALIDDRHSTNSEYFLFPTVGNSTGLGIDAYLESMKPVQSITTSYVTSPAKAYLVEYNASGKYLTFNSMTLGSLLIRYRLPSGFETSLVVPNIVPGII